MNIHIFTSLEIVQILERFQQDPAALGPAGPIMLQIIKSHEALRVNMNSIAMQSALLETSLKMAREHIDTALVGVDQSKLVAHRTELAPFTPIGPFGTRPTTEKKEGE